MRASNLTGPLKAIGSWFGALKSFWKFTLIGTLFGVLIVAFEMISNGVFSRRLLTFPAYTAAIGAFLYVQVELFKLLIQLLKLYLVVLVALLVLVAAVFLAIELPKLIATF